MFIFQIRKTEHVSVWAVAWPVGLKWEGPTCSNGHATAWRTSFAPQRYYNVLHKHCMRAVYNQDYNKIFFINIFCMILLCLEGGHLR